jgi:hypothetical protein
MDWFPEHLRSDEDRNAWWWKYGFKLRDCRDTTKPKARSRFICVLCHRKGLEGRSYNVSKFTFNASGAGNIKSHLTGRHKLQAGIFSFFIIRLLTGIYQDPSRAQLRRSVFEQLITKRKPTTQNVMDAIISGYKKEGLHMLILNWVTTHNLSFQIVESDEFRAILLYGNSLVCPSHIPSADTLIRLLFAEYERASTSVRSVLQTALHLIHFCFDGWTSRSNLSFLGINAQFVDKNFRLRKVLLGLPQLDGRHTGKAIAEEVSRILSFWELDDKLGFFTLDNATNNDTAMEVIGDNFGFDGTERRLRCAPHCINRVVRAMLYGNETQSLADALDDTPEIYDADGDEEAVDAALQEALDEDQEDAFGINEPDDDYIDAGIVVGHPLELPQFTYPISEVIDHESCARFRKKGPIGKIHNVGVALRKSPRLRKMYLQAQVSQSVGLSNEVTN